MRFLVTGGAGFIGSTLVDRILDDGHEVDVIDNLATGRLRNLSAARARRTGTLKFHQFDIRDEGLTPLVVRHPPDVVFHLATSTERHVPVSPADVADQDLVGTMAVLDAAVQAGARKIVLTASVKARSAPGLAPIARRAAAQLVSEARESTGIECTILCLPTVFGPRQRAGYEGSVVATFAERLAQRKPCVLHGGGEQTRDLVFVHDCVDALVRCVEAGDGLSIDVGTGAQTPILKLYRAMAAIVGTDDEPVPGAQRDDEPGAVPVDPARAHMYLGWEPFTPLADALAETVVAYMDEA